MIIIKNTLSLTCVGAFRPFSRGEGGPAKPGRMRNGEMLSAGRSSERAHTETFPPAFLFSHRLMAATASPREKRQALPRRCVSYLGFAYRCSSTPGSPHIKGEFIEGIKAAPMIIKQLDKLELIAIVNVPFLCGSFSIVRFYQMLPSNAEHTMPMKQRQDL